VVIISEVTVAKVRQVGVVDIIGVWVETGGSIKPNEAQRPKSVVIHHQKVYEHPSKSLHRSNLSIAKRNQLFVNQNVIFVEWFLSDLIFLAFITE